MVRAIVLETSGHHSQVALATEAGIIAVRNISAARKHGRDVAPALAAMLAECQWTAESVDLVAVNDGPGSYTGIRVGVVTAASFAYASGSSVLGIDTMSILAETVPAQFQKYSAIVDAQQGLVYHHRGQRGAESADRPMIEVVAADLWASELTPDVFVTGPALSRYRDLVPNSVTVAESFDPPAEALWNVALHRWHAGVRGDWRTIEPCYLRPSSAEQKWDRRLAVQQASSSDIK